MNVWVWHADGPERRMLGVCALKDEAMDACERLFMRAAVTSAAVELSWLRFDPNLTYYEHSGYGWTASKDSETGLVVWTAFEPASPDAATKRR